MPTWSSTLDQAGITESRLRRDYTDQRRLVARFARAEYVAVRLLLPASLIPDVIAATAFMHHTDNLIDQGPLVERLASLVHWDRQVRAALDTGSAGEPVLRALLHAAERRPQLRAHAQDFLAGAPAEVQWEGFEDEDAFQHYVDAYSHPAFMVIACLIEPPSAQDAYAGACRTFIEASQRLDFLEDLAEDLSGGRLGIPQTALAQCGLSRAGLDQEPAPHRVRELVEHQVAWARPRFAASRHLIELVEPPNKPFMRALVSLQELRLRMVETAGPALLRKSPRTPVAGALRLLAGEYRSARINKKSRATQRPVE
ncbi:squalene/phytoene synthase family protein [Streptomyces sp. NPDC059828]|uniref:squalene/phytoene synthase family protein n=1 Tax=Streptomyces sp. NPDC059828 TaxID=3346965 RepID=UPI003648E6DB